MKKILIIAGISLVLLVGAECFLRLYLGFCDTVLMQPSDKYEYIAQPGQQRFRFRKHVQYNEYSMRSKPLRGDDTLRVLGFGDSVINGGAATDQDSLATTIIENRLAQRYGDQARCLNISAGSWGPDNCFAYLEEKGDFGASLIFLVVSSHDAHDTMDFVPVVDVYPAYSSKQYKLAVWELTDRYLIPRLKHGKAPQADPIVKGHVFNPGFEAFYTYTQRKGIPFFIYLHPDRDEVQHGRYGYQGGEIIKFCAERGIMLVEGLASETLGCFRDGIHINDKGQKIVAETLLPLIEEMLHIKWAGP